MEFDCLVVIYTPKTYLPRILKFSVDRFLMHVMIYNAKKVNQKMHVMIYNAKSIVDSLNNDNVKKTTFFFFLAHRSLLIL